MAIEIMFGECQYSKSSIQNESEYLSYQDVNSDLYNEFILFYEQLKPPKLKMSYLQGCFLICQNLEIVDPKYIIGTHIGKYQNKTMIMPSLILEKDFVTIKKKRTKFLINDEMIEKIGNIMEEMYHFKFKGFERIGNLK